MRFPVDRFGTIVESTSGAQMNGGELELEVSRRALVLDKLGVGRGKIEIDDAFFVSPMDFYTTDAPSYADAISTRRLYWTMMWMFVNFYVISFTTHPFRTIKVLFTAVTQGVEEARYAKWFVDRFFTRRKWRRMTQDG